MFTAEDLTNVLVLERVLGARRFGHFDHDAANVTGPAETNARRGATLLTRSVDGIAVSIDPTTRDSVPTF